MGEQVSRGSSWPSELHSGFPRAQLPSALLAGRRLHEQMEQETERTHFSVLEGHYGDKPEGTQKARG